MGQISKKWVVNRTNREYVAYLANAASISPAIAQVLINRGIKTPDEVSDFISAGINSISGPFEIDGMTTAVEAINKAKTAGKRVLVHGDYDVDGLTATAIMTDALRSIGIDARYFIPSRLNHGYGFGAAGVKAAKDINAAMIVTVDCGITSFEAVELSSKEGIDVIITDHHEPERNRKGFKIPPALAVINPKLKEMSGGAASLSGAGIALKVAQALGIQLERLLDLAALGTLADVVPLLGENRAIVREGFRLINEGARHGIRALKSVSGLDGREIKPGHLAYTLLPRINAPGRMSDASEVVELFLTDKKETAEDIALSLDKRNTERQKIEEVVYKEAIKMLGEHRPPAIVLGGQWHEGVIGIVASKLAEQFHRPAFIFSIKDGVAKGSARSIPEFDIYAGLSACKPFLISFGGHRQAAGLKVKVPELKRFEERIAAIVQSEVKDFVPTLNVDADIGLEEVTLGLTRELSSLEPFGCGNADPLFGSKKVKVINARVVGGNHLKMKLKDKGKTLDAIGFDMGSSLETLKEKDTVDALYKVSLNEWNGTKTPQLEIKGLRIPA